MIEAIWLNESKFICNGIICPFALKFARGDTQESSTIVDVLTVPDTAEHASELFAEHVC